MRPSNQLTKEVPLKIVGSNHYGKIPKISDEATWNMIISDDFLVNYFGYEVVATGSFTLTGRCCFTSVCYGNIIFVIGNEVFGAPPPISGTSPLQIFKIGEISSYTTTVSIDENLAGQIAICDGTNIYIYNWKNPTNPPLQPVDLPVDQYTGKKILPGYVTYQNGHFNTVNTESGSWFLSQLNNGLQWNWSAINGPVTTTIQTKPTNAKAVLRAPGLGNLLYVFGETVTELWYYTGNSLSPQGLFAFPYQRSTSVSFDYGCLNPNTIASMDQMVCWLGINEKSGPVIMAANGAEITRISDDGIDYQLARLVHPEESTGFLFKLDGHLFYQITFHSPEDNFSLMYDFNAKAFFSCSDEHMNYHIAESMCFFHNNYYFVSLRDGNIYRASSDLYTYNYTKSTDTEANIYNIPFVRVTPTFRLPDSSNFIVPTISLLIDQGNAPQFISGTPGWAGSPPDPINPFQPRIDCAISTNGGETFGSYITQEMNPVGIRRNRVTFTRFGIANEITFQFRFQTSSFLAVSDGVMAYYQ